MKEANLSFLHYKLNTNWVAFPSWTKFFFALGEALSQSRSTTGRIVIGLAVPTRAYAACLIASSLVVNNALYQSNFISQEEYFNSLCSLPTGTPVIYHNPFKDKKFKALINGCTEHQGEKYLKIQVQKNYQLSSLVKKADAFTVSVNPEPMFTLPSTQSGHSYNNSTNFLGNLFKAGSNKVDLTLFSLISRLDCLIIGSKKQIREEIENTKIAIQISRKASSNFDFVSGTFQDILKVKSFQEPSSPFHSEVCSTNGQESEGLTNGEIPPFVILDGSIPFLKWRDYWSQSNLVAIFDRTAPHFDEAVAQFNQDYTQNNSGLEWDGLLTRIPKGIEILAYKEVMP